jgi:N-acetylglucosaminyldiphosphoundecaprenol N-acetyl-beta-D-mannosaminyltransferase
MPMPKAPDAGVPTPDGGVSRVGRVRVLGVPLARVSMASALAEAGRLVESGGGPRWIGVCNTYTAVVARRDPGLRAFYEEAALNLPDGMPLVWASRLYGRPIPERVSGPDFLLAFARRAAARGWRFYFLGADEGTLAAMVRTLGDAAPGLVVAGTCAPPYGPFSESVDRRLIDAVNAARADVLWVGMSAPKQETWLRRAGIRLRVRLGVGVGAAFGFFAGRVRRAPAWMRGAGLEWAYRLSQEPQRLWRRYLVGNTGFCAGVVRDLLTGACRQP